MKVSDRPSLSNHARLMLCCFAIHMHALYHVFEPSTGTGTAKKACLLRVNLDGWAEACNVLHRRYELCNGDIIDGRQGVAHHDHLTAKPQEFPTNSAETISRDCKPLLPMAVMNGTEHLLCCAMLCYAMLCYAMLCHAVLFCALLCCCSDCAHTVSLPCVLC